MQNIWQAHYQSGVPATLGKIRFTSLVDMFNQVCQQRGDHTAFINFGAHLSYRRLEAQSRHFAAYLQHRLGLRKGDCIAIMLPNLLQFPIALFGALRAGLVVTNVNPLYTADELAYQLKDSQAKAILVLENFAHIVAEILPQDKLEHVIVTRFGDALPFPKRQIMNFVVRYVKKMVPKWDIPSAKWFNQALLEGHDLGLCPVTLDAQDIAFLQYTGGTTGRAKGAILLHRNLLANVGQVIAWTADTLVDGKETIVTALPLYHVFALTVNLFAFFQLGARNLLITNPRDIPSFVAELAKVRFTFITGVNTLFNALLRHSKFRQLDFSSLKFSIAGGMAAQKSVAQTWRKVTGCVLLQGYGLTEASPVVSMNPLNAKEFNGSIGLPLPSTDIGIFNDEDEPLDIGETGELWVKGPQVMPGYWQAPDKTKETIASDGWLKTGDIAKVDEEGFIYIVDRKKDMINVSGFKVFPNEVEDIIANFPTVNEVGVVGIPHPVTGEQVVAYITVDEAEAFDMHALSAYCRQHLTSYKIPRKIKIIKQLPKTPVGKVLRRHLRDIATKDFS